MCQSCHPPLIHLGMFGINQIPPKCCVFTPIFNLNWKTSSSSVSQHKTSKVETPDVWMKVYLWANIPVLLTVYLDSFFMSLDLQQAFWQKSERQTSAVTAPYSQIWHKNSNYMKKHAQAEIGLHHYSHVLHPLSNHLRSVNRPMNSYQAGFSFYSFFGYQHNTHSKWF